MHDEALHEDLTGVRSEWGTRDFTTLRSVRSTAEKQGLNRIETLMRGSAVLLDGLRCQRVLAPAPLDSLTVRDWTCVLLGDSAFRPSRSPMVSGQFS